MTNRGIYARNRKSDVARIAGVVRFAFRPARLWALVPGAAVALGLAGWIDPAASAPRVRPPGPRVAPVHVAEPDPVHLVRITRYADRATEPRLLQRSPFEFDRAPRTGASTRPRRTADLPVPRPVLPPAVLEPPPSLSGIAEQSGPEGLVRTAVLTDPDGTVRFAVIGQVVAAAFQVSAIESDRVVFVHTHTGRTTQLFLK